MGVIVPDVSTPLLIVVSVLHPANVNAAINMGIIALNFFFIMVLTSFFNMLLGKNKFMANIDVTCLKDDLAVSYL